LNHEICLRFRHLSKQYTSAIEGSPNLNVNSCLDQYAMNR
jgi:hypothetical protein